MKHTKDIKISKILAEKINELLTKGDRDFGEDCTIIKTVDFNDGYEMDIKCCGVQWDENSENNTAWTEAVLFHNGNEITCTEPSDEFVGTWILEADKNEYIVNVIIE